MNITIDNLTLRPLESNDASAFFDLIDRNRIRLRDYFPVTISVITNLENCKRYIEEKAEQALIREHYCYVIADKQSRLLGLIILKNIDWRVPKGELAYFIDKDYEGKGITSRALSALVSYCFDTMEMNKLFILTAVDNHPSRKLAEKTGFETEGILRKNFRLSDGRLVDNVYYGLLRK